MGVGYQGKCEQMMDYIKKLRACIRAFQELDATHTCEKEDLMKQLEDVKQSRAETGVLSYFALKTIFPISASIVLYCTGASCHKKKSVQKKIMITEKLALI
jgi:hypothetical protein